MDFSGLTATERFRYDIIMTARLQVYEQAFADHDARTYPEDFIDVHRIRLAAGLDSAGGRTWWTSRRYWFTKQFRAVADEILERPSVESAASGILSAPGTGTSE